MSEELKALENEAAQVDALIAPTEPAVQVQAQQEQQAQAAVVSEHAEIVGLLTLAAALASPMFPSIEKIYTPETIDSIATAAVPVLVKRGWSVGSALGKYGEELALLSVVLPVGFATYKGVMGDIAEAEKAKEKDAAGDEPAKAVPDGAQPDFAARG